ncbi:MAG: glycosyltransferase family 4 protein [Lachnospiraceae bacterium]|nr:glycosyltransferase family 4 protein [Lachnospiraceae bacterium]
MEKKMNVIFLSISYSEDDHISFYEELLQEFVLNGHSVYVACASEKRKGRETCVQNERGITVLRIKTGNITGNINVIKKGMSTVLMDSTFKKAISKYYTDIKFDLILYPTPPITLVDTVEYLKNKCKASTYLLLKDIFPQNAVDLGMISKTGLRGCIYKFFRKKEKNLYYISDYIGCMSQANVNYVIQNNKEVDRQKVEISPNCVKPIDFTKNIEKNISIREKYLIPIDKVVFVYGGNLGKPQGINFFLECIGACKDIEKAYILVVGGGSEAVKIQEYIDSNHINNAKIISTLPKEEYELLANACDVGLVFLDYRFTIPNFPSRILSYMQTSKPVIVATDPVTDMGNIVEKNNFGWKCISNHPAGFVNCVENAIEADLTSMGKNGRIYLESNYSVTNGYNSIMKHFGRVI